MYTDQIQTLEQSLVESKKLAIDHQTKIMQLTVQLESSDGQLQAQVCFELYKNRIDIFCCLETFVGCGY